MVDIVYTALASLLVVVALHIAVFWVTRFIQPPKPKVVYLPAPAPLSPAAPAAPLAPPAPPAPPSIQLPTYDPAPLASKPAAAPPALPPPIETREARPVVN